MSTEDEKCKDIKDKRIPCPLDNNHTCSEIKLAQHLKVCNAKKLIDASPGYIVDGINSGDHLNVVHTTLSQLDQQVVDNLIKKVEIAYDKLPVVDELILEHDVLASELKNPLYGKHVKKHLIQNSSLLGHIERAGLAKDDTCFIEFGAGKGKLTYWLAQMLKNNEKTTIMLVDRSSHRHKNDNRLKNGQSSVNVIRIRADIANLCLSKIDDIKTIKHKVGIAKHLCGAATDLTIRCLSKLMQDDSNSGVAGLVIAFCCHHQCNYGSYTGKKFLETSGFTPDDFTILCSIASWATCGFSKIHKNMDSSIDQITQKMEFDRKELIGRKVKSLLNWGRIEYLKNLGFQSNLYFYTSRDVSLENVCVVATKKIE